MIYAWATGVRRAQLGLLDLGALRDAELKQNRGLIFSSDSEAARYTLNTPSAVSSPARRAAPRGDRAGPPSGPSLPPSGALKELQLIVGSDVG
jgi:hypothetical protein